VALLRIVAQLLRPPDHVIVIFGANGDLSRRKLLPALFHLDREGLMPKGYRVIGNSRSAMSDEEFRAFARDAIDEFGRSPVDNGWSEFASRLSYVSHDFTPEEPKPIEEAVQQAEEELGGEPNRLLYLSVPPKAFARITEAVGTIGLQHKARVVYEKPFGEDLKAFRELTEVAHEFLHETQIYRIDHFLGKETVQNILALRFANGMFEPVWNRSHIDLVQIDVPEEIGIGTRAGFYDHIGALRDMVVTHLFQVLGFVAMEPPASLAPRRLADEVLKIFESMQPLEPTDVVRGQYEGYRSEDGVANDSETETFVAARVAIDNWRWAGVPFYLRTGKRMAEQRSAVTLVFRDPPRQMFKEADVDWLQQDHLTLELGPREGITVTFLAKIPGPTIELAPANMVFKYEGRFGSEMIEAYERLIHDALLGDRTLFTRGDGIGRTWELVDGILTNPPPLHLYPDGSWGPQEAERLIAPRRWHLPD
jgi:glucose-6-phosphate 1-dehydrogenase